MPRKKTTNPILVEMRLGFKEMREGFSSIDRRFSSIDRRFEAFKKENLKAHEDMATSIEKLGQEFASFTRGSDRLKERVDTHEKVLVENKLLAVAG